MSSPDLNPVDLDDDVREVVAAVRPLRIVLFGSMARNEAGPESDIDLMVEVADGSDRMAVLRQLYVLGIRRVDFVVSTPEIVAAYSTSMGLVYRDIARDGRELYAAA